MFHHENASGPQALPQEDAEEDGVDAKPRSGTNPSTLLPPEDQEVASDEEDVKESGPVESRDCRLRAGRLRIPKDTIYAYICSMRRAFCYWNAAALILLGDVAKEPVQNGQIQVPQPRGWFHATRATVAQHQGWWALFDRKPRLQKYSIPKTQKDRIGENRETDKGPHLLDCGPWSMVNRRAKKHFRWVKYRSSLFII